MSLRASPQTGVAIPQGFRYVWEIATPACALVRDDMRFNWCNCKLQFTSAVANRADHPLALVNGPAKGSYCQRRLAAKLQFIFPIPNEKQPAEIPQAVIILIRDGWGAIFQSHPGGTGRPSGLPSGPEALPIRWRCACHGPGSQGRDTGPGGGRRSWPRRA